MMMTADTADRRRYTVAEVRKGLTELTDVGHLSDQKATMAPRIRLDMESRHTAADHQIATQQTAAVITARRTGLPENDSEWRLPNVRSGHVADDQRSPVVDSEVRDSQKDDRTVAVRHETTDRTVAGRTLNALLKVGTAMESRKAAHAVIAAENARVQDATAVIAAAAIAAAKEDGVDIVAAGKLLISHL